MEQLEGKTDAELAHLAQLVQEEQTRRRRNQVRTAVEGTIKSFQKVAQRRKDKALERAAEKHAQTLNEPGGFIGVMGVDDSWRQLNPGELLVWHMDRSRLAQKIAKWTVAALRRQLLLRNFVHKSVRVPGMLAAYVEAGVFDALDENDAVADQPVAAAQTAVLEFDRSLID